jgi:hypothetical protein
MLTRHVKRTSMSNVNITPDYSLLLSILDRPIAFHRVFVTISGSVLAGLMLSQAVYWHPRGRAADHWFHKTREEWATETGMSRSEQETARKKLLAIKTKDGAPIWSEDLRGVPAKMWYRVDVAALFQCILESGNAADQLAGIPPTGRKDSDQLDGDNPASKLVQKSPPLYTENTSDINAQKQKRATRTHAKKSYQPEDYPDL